MSVLLASICARRGPGTPASCACARAHLCPLCSRASTRHSLENEATSERFSILRHSRRRAAWRLLEARPRRTNRVHDCHLFLVFRCRARVRRDVLHARCRIRHPRSSGGAIGSPRRDRRRAPKHDRARAGCSVAGPSLLAPSSRRILAVLAAHRTRLAPSRTRNRGRDGRYRGDWRSA